MGELLVCGGDVFSFERRLDSPDPDVDVLFVEGWDLRLLSS